MIGKIIIYNDRKNFNRKVAWLDKIASEIINSERIFFDVRNLKIRLPNFDDNKTYKLTILKTRKNTFSGSCFSFSNRTSNEIDGEYELEKNGDEFILFKK